MRVLFYYATRNYAGEPVLASANNPYNTASLGFELVVV